MERLYKIATRAAVFLLLLTGCTPKMIVAKPTLAPKTITSVTIPLPAEVTPPVETVTAINAPHNDFSGNHFVEGKIDLQNARVIDIPLNGTPLWLVSVPHDQEAVFAAELNDGSVQAFKVSNETYEAITLSVDKLPAGMPPLLAIQNGSAQLINPPPGASPYSNPILLNGRLIYIAANGDLVMNETDSQTRLTINALYDGKILVDAQNRLLILTEPTTHYNHGVLGDENEASGVAVIETQPELKVVQTIHIAEPDVIEGLSPIWADVDGDGMLDIIVTLSNTENGSRIVAYHEDGTLLAESDPIGNGYRWRHLIGVGQFTEDGLPLLTNVRTPHIGGVVEFLQYSNGRLEITQQIRGYSTHSIGSRNLDSALIGDFNNDGIVELLAPDQPHNNLAIISPAGVIATIPLPNTLTTNLSAIPVNGMIYLGAGTKGKLRIWIP